jgi:hypothetical protein
MKYRDLLPTWPQSEHSTSDLEPSYCRCMADRPYIIRIRCGTPEIIIDRNIGSDVIVKKMEISICSVSRCDAKRRDGKFHYSPADDSNRCSLPLGN